MARGNRSGASRVEIGDGEVLRTKAARALQGIELTGDVSFSPAALAFLGRRPEVGERKAFYLRRKLARKDMDRELNIQKVRAERWVAGESVGKNRPSTKGPPASRAKALSWADDAGSDDGDGDEDAGEAGVGEDTQGSETQSPAAAPGGAGSA